MVIIGGPFTLRGNLNWVGRTIFINNKFSTGTCGVMCLFFGRIVRGVYNILYPLIVFLLFSLSFFSLSFFSFFSLGLFGIVVVIFFNVVMVVYVTRGGSLLLQGPL